MRANADLDIRFRQYSHYTEVKQMAYNVASLQQDKKYQSLAVLSYFHGEGKTLFCVALALAYAETCRSKALIVDTTMFHTPGSLALKECLSSAESRVDYISLADRMRKRAESNAPPPEPIIDKTGKDLATPSFLATENDFSMILNVARGGPEQYGLVILDTVPLTAKNRNNIDPRLVARVANASVLVVSEKLLNAAQLSEQLKIVQDPSLHLIGTISNEEADL